MGTAHGQLRSPAQVIGRAFVFLLLMVASQATGASDVRLDGKYEYRTDPQSRELLGDSVCFFPSSASASRVPRERGDRRDVWFCFSNRSAAQRQLHIPGKPARGSCGYHGTAVIEVSGYKVYRGEGDGHDTATLRKVHKAQKPIALPCG
jgi:hypothetical protein